MNILYLAHRLPFPPNKGDKMRAFRHIEHLSRKHDVSCACFVDTDEDMRHVASLREVCKEVVVVRLKKTSALIRGGIGLLCGSTVTQSYYSHAGMTRALIALTERRRFDRVIAFSSSMAPYALQVSAPRRILDLCDCDSQKWLAYAERSATPMRQIYRAEGQRLAEMERRWARAFDATMLITAPEATFLRSHVHADRLHVVGNGVDLPEVAAPARARSNPPARVGFVGVMDYRPNIDAVCWFVENCWREIREAVPDATFQIVGRNPARRVRALADVPGVRVLGEVEDVSEHLGAFSVSVAPMRIACGLQNKVLEAMVAGLPVVLTERAARAVGGEDGRNFFVADQPDRFIRTVVRLLRSPAESQQIGENARAFVRRCFRWEDHLKTLDAVVEDAPPMPHASHRHSTVATPVLV